MNDILLLINQILNEFNEDTKHNCELCFSKLNNEILKIKIQYITNNSKCYIIEKLVYVNYLNYSKGIGYRILNEIKDEIAERLTIANNVV